MSTFSHSYLEVMPRLLELIKKKEGVEHEQFKGALYVILGRILNGVALKINKFFVCSFRVQKPVSPDEAQLGYA